MILVHQLNSVEILIGIVLHPSFGSVEAEIHSDLVSDAGIVDDACRRRTDLSGGGGRDGMIGGLELIDVGVLPDCRRREDV